MMWVRKKVRTKAIRGLAAAGAIGLAAACGGGSTSPSGGGTPPPNTTITITSSGVVSPKNLVVSAGTQVTFVNNSPIVHNMYSDPHPEHTDCPEIDQVGYLAPGQSKQTGNLNTVRICGYHDHVLFTDTRLQGTITIQ